MLSFTALFVIGCERESEVQKEIIVEFKNWEITRSKVNFFLPVSNINFIDTLNGFISGNGILYKTIDAGKSWQKMNNETKLILNSPFFLNKDTGFAVGHENVFLKTTDGGENWSTTYLNFEGYISMYGLHFFNELEGLSIVRIITDVSRSINKYLIAKTSDGGNTWELQNLETQYSGKFHLINDKVFIEGQDSEIFKSSDKGNHWEIINSPAMMAITYIDEKIMIIRSGMNYYKTTDGGSNWNITDFPYTESSVSHYPLTHFYNEIEGFVIEGIYRYEGKGDYPVFKGSEIYYTEDGGETWTDMGHYTSINLNMISFLGKDLGFGMSSHEFYKIKRKP